MSSGTEVGRLYATVDADTGKFKSGLASAEGDFNGFAGRLTSKATGAGKAIGAALAVGAVAAGVALAGAATVGVKSYMDIESAAADAASKMDLGEIAQKSGKTIEESFKGIKEHVIAVSRELGQLNTNAFDPTQIATALAGLAAGGFDVAAASASNLSPILSLATATNYDLADSAELAMSTMNQWGMGVEDLTKISDIYTLASGKSAAGMQDFKYAMTQAGPAAKASGVSFEQTVAAISKLRDVGVPAETAGVAVRNALIKMASAGNDVTTKLDKSTGQMKTTFKGAAEVLNRYGMTVDEIDPKTNNFTDSLAKLKARMGDNALAGFAEMFGTENASALLQLADLSTGVNQLTVDLGNAGGSAEQMAKLMLDTLGGSLDAALGAATDLAIGIGEDLAPTIKGLLDWFSSDGAPAIRELYEAFKEGDWDKIGNMMADAVKKGWNKLKDIGKDLYNKIKSVNWGGLGNYVTEGIKSAWNGLKSLGSQLLGWLQDIDFSSVGKSVAAAFVGIGSWIYDAIAGIDWGALGQLAIDSFKNVIDYFSNIGKTIYDAITSIDWSGIGDKALTSLRNISDRISEVFSGISWGDISTGITEAINSAIETLSDIGGKVFDYLDKVEWSKLGESIADGIKTCVKGLGNVAEQIGNLFEKHSWDSVGQDIGKKIESGIGKIKDYASKIVDGIKASLPKLEAFGQEAGGKIRDAFGNIKDYASKIITGLWDGLKAWVTNGKDLENFGALIIDAIAGGIVAVLRVGNAIMDAIVSIFTWDNLKKAFDFVALGTIAIGDIAVGMMQEAWIIGYKIGGAIAGGIADAMDAVSFDVLGQHVGLGEYTTGLREFQRGAEATRLTAEKVSGIDIISKTYNPPATTQGATGVRTTDSKGNVLIDGIPNGENVFAAPIEQRAFGIGPAYSIGAAGGMREKSGQATVSTVSYQGKTYTPEDFAIALANEGYNSNEIYAVLQDIKINTKSASSGASWSYNASKIDEAITPIFEAKAKSELSTAKEKAAIEIEGEKAGAKIDNDGEKDSIALSLKGGKDINDLLLAGAEADADAWLSGAFASAQAQEAAAREAAQTLMGGSQQAATAIQLGSQVAANFTTQAGQAVKIGLDASGREIAVIGQVAQQRFTQAGGELYSKVQVAGNDLQTKGIASGNAIQTGGLSAKNSLQSGGTSAQSALQTGASALNQAASGVGSAASKLLGFDVGSLMRSTFGTLSGSNATANSTPTPTGHTATTTTGKFDDPWMNAGKWANPAAYADGTETTGPQMALIGEAGKEFVIPTKKKRWDLLFAAMRSYGIKTFAEGGEAGAGGSTEGVDADEMKAYFGIRGLASMSKQVQKIITDLKNFFRISWGIIKAEGSVYWRQINQIISSEAIYTRDNAWQAAIDIRNTWMQANAQVLTDATANYAAMWPAIEPSISYLKSSMISSFQDAGSQVVSAINQMVMGGESSLQAFSVSWGDTWSQMLQELADAQTTISGAISSIAAELRRINVSVNINASMGGGGSGGGGYYSGSEGDWACGDCTGGGAGTNSIAYDPRSDACIPFNKPDPSLNTSDPFYIAMGATPISSSNSSGAAAVAKANPGYSLPAIFRARGGLVEKPELDVIADQGPEIILPAKLTRMFVSLADMGMGHGGGSSKSQSIEVINRIYLDGKEITNTVMKRATKEMRLRGAIATR